MRQKFNRLLLILSGIFVTILIAASLVITFFFPELLSSRSKTQNEATAELFAMDTYLLSEMLWVMLRCMFLHLFQSHGYRHTVATMFYDNMVSLQSIRDYLGHHYEEMTRQYIDYIPKKLSQANEEYFGDPESEILLCSIRVKTYRYKLMNRSRLLMRSRFPYNKNK